MKPRPAASSHTGRSTFSLRLVHRDRLVHHRPGEISWRIVVGRAGLSGVHTILKPGPDGRGSLAPADAEAAAFSGGLSGRGSLAGKEIYCPPPGLKGHEIMISFEQFLNNNPDMADKPYGDAMASTLSRAFPCQDR